MSDSSIAESAKPSVAGGGGSEASRIGDVKQWLAHEFGQAGKEVPQFEFTPRSVAYLHNLVTLSQAKTQASKIVAADFRLKASEYRSQGLSPSIHLYTYTYTRKSLNLGFLFLVLWFQRRELGRFWRA